MTAPFERLHGLFRQTMDLPPSERDAFLVRECVGDPDLLTRMRDLLRAVDTMGGFLDPNVLDDSGMRDYESDSRIGDYRVLRPLGRGGMGQVFLAEQVSLGRLVALKTLLPTPWMTRREIDRFLREARAMARLRHPHIVRVHVVDRDAERDVHYFAMDFVDGSDLGRELDRLRCVATGTSSPPEDIPILPAHVDPRALPAFVAIVADAADALQHAHDHQLVHRDVKPQNLLLDRDGSVFVADFGIARDESLGSLSRTGEAAGTPYYMSPEQARAQRDAIDCRTDVYSLGVVLYELLTLRKPFEGNSVAEVLHRIGLGKPQCMRSVNPRVPRDLEIVCETAMALERSDRYGSAGEFAEDLRRFLAHEAIRARPIPWHIRARRWLRRNRIATATSTVVAALFVASLLTQRWRNRSDDLARIRPNLEAAIARFGEMEPQDLHAALDEAVAVRRRWGSLDDQCDLAESTLRQRMEERAEELGAQARSTMRSRDSGARGGATRKPMVVTRGERPAHEATLAVARSSLYRRRVDPELIDGMLQQASVDVRLIVHGESAEAAEAQLVTVNPDDGRWIEVTPLGSTPLPPVWVAPGTYRLVILGPGGAFAELDFSQPEAGSILHLEAWIRPPDKVRVGMAHVPAATVTLDRSAPAGDGGYDRRRMECDVAPFFTDRFPVTNGEYAEFLEATVPSGKHVPPYFKVETRDETWRRRPVTEVALESARAYAAWRGKRLPTLPEIVLAARGPRIALFPWGNDPRPELLATFRLDRRAYSATPKSGDPGALASVKWLRENLRPVTEAPAEAQGPHRLHELIGNVAVWTETPPLGGTDMSEALRFAFRETAGVPARTTTELCIERGMNPSVQHKAENAYLDLGFRCVVSAEPTGVSSGH